jgi:hypothetical protein
MEDGPLIFQMVLKLHNEELCSLYCSPGIVSGQCKKCSIGKTLAYVRGKKDSHPNWESRHFANQNIDGRLLLIS